MAAAPNDDGEIKWLDAGKYEVAERLLHQMMMVK